MSQNDDLFPVAAFDFFSDFLFRISDFSYLPKMTLHHQGSPGKFTFTV
jgi:hypothetical protein